MIVVVWFAVEIGDSAKYKEYEPAQVQRSEMIYMFPQQRQYQVSQ
jgi:hypothetical protein